MLTGMRMDCPGRACRSTVTVGGAAEVVAGRDAAGTAVRSPTPEGRDGEGWLILGTPHPDGEGEKGDSKGPRGR